MLAASDDHTIHGNYQVQAAKQQEQRSYLDCYRATPMQFANTSGLTSRQTLVTRENEKVIHHRGLTRFLFKSTFNVDENECYAVVQRACAIYIVIDLLVQVLESADPLGRRVTLISMKLIE
jgi:pyoverdine/dityrosine biosynthesis protein Dit1